MVPSIIPSLLKRLGGLIPSAALPFERNLVILKRRLPRQTSSGNEPLPRPIWNTFLDPAQVPTARIPRDSMDVRRRSAVRRSAGGEQGSKELREGALNRLNAHSELRETFLSPANFFRNSWLTRHSARIMSRLRERSPKICPALPISSSLLSLSLSPSLSLLPSLPGAASFPLRASARNIINLGSQKCIKKA